MLFLITRLNLNKFICQSHKGLTVSNTKQVTHVSKGPANRFDTFPFNDTGKSDQGSVKVLTDGSITDLKHYCVFDLALKITLNSLGLKSICVSWKAQKVGRRLKSPNAEDRRTESQKNSR